MVHRPFIGYIDFSYWRGRPWRAFAGAIFGGKTG